MGKFFAHLLFYFAVKKTKLRLTHINYIMNTEEKIALGRVIYNEYRRQYYTNDFINATEREYVSAIIEACELNCFDSLIPVRDMCIALEYCQRANRAVRIVLDAQYLSGDELEAYRQRYAGNTIRLRGAGRKAAAISGRSYHIEYGDRPLSLFTLSTRALLQH